MYDCIIVGSGPAGFSAGIYVSQAGYNTAIVLGSEYGGNIAKTTHLGNYPGLLGVKQGLDLINIMSEQSIESGCNIIFAELIEFNYINNTYSCKLNTGEVINSKSLILATGSTPRTLKLPLEEKYFSKGIHTCATCDGNFYKNKTVAVIGGGNSAAEYTRYLSNITNKVYLIYRKNKLKINDNIYNIISNLKNVEIIYNANIKTLNEINNKLSSISLDNNQTLSIDGIFYALGHIPNTSNIKSNINHNIIDKYSLYSQECIDTNNIKGLFVAGDCSRQKYQQAIVAAADGALAGMKTIEYLGELNQ
jgi:thioredoxin reductase (NADPH)